MKKDEEFLFTVGCLDHVAIRCIDMERSIKWYKEVLGLTEYQVKEWGDFPVFMMSGQTGIAIFPAKWGGPQPEHQVGIDHFAFNVDQNSFENIQHHLRELNIHFTFQDHTFFHSIYMKDPDGHTVELTTLVVDAKSFYK